MKTTTRNKKLELSLKRILKEHLGKEEINKLLTSMHQSIEKTGNWNYPLTETQSLIVKEEERETKKKRYANSPFPLLSNIEYFRNFVGGYNRKLQEYGINQRAKKPEESTTNYGLNILLIDSSNLTSKGNRYLKSQYKRLEKMRNRKN